MTAYSKTMGQALREVYDVMLNDVVESQLVEGTIDKIKDIVSKKQHSKIDGVTVDLFTASAISQIYDKVNDANKKKMEKLPITKLAALAMKMMKKEDGDPEDQYDDEEERQQTEEADLDEGKMAQMHQMMKDKKSAAQIAKEMGLDVKTVKALMAGYNEEVEIDEHKGDKPHKHPHVDDEERQQTNEAKYELYHKDFSTAMQHAYKMAKKLHGITVDPKEIDAKVATGPSKPSEGKTNSYRLKGDKGAIQVQVYNKGGSKPFELNFYKEELAKIKGKTPGDKGRKAAVEDDIERAEKKGDKKEVEKLKEADLDEASARGDAKRSMSKDKDLSRGKDSADVDDYATDDDIKGASKNIMMQLRKSISLRGNFPVEFMDKKKIKIPAKIAQAATTKYNALRRPVEKQDFQTRIGKSYKDMLTAVNESLQDDLPVIENTILDRIAKIIQEKNNG